MEKMIKGNKVKRSENGITKIILFRKALPSIEFCLSLAFKDDLTIEQPKTYNQTVGEQTKFRNKGGQIRMWEIHTLRRQRRFITTISSIDVSLHF